MAAPSGRPSGALQRAHLLVDQYFAMRDATIAFHRNNDPKTAFALLSGIESRINGSGLDGMGDERKLVGDMVKQAAFYAGYTGERPPSLRHLAVVGEWKVVDAQGFKDVRRGDHFSFSDDEDFVHRRANPRRNEEDEDWEIYEINDRQIHLTESRLVMDYRISRDRLHMTNDNGREPLRLTLVRSKEAATD